MQEELISIEEKSKQDSLLQTFRPYFVHLIEVLIIKGQWPTHENMFTNEDKDSFQNYRLDILECMVNTYSMSIKNYSI